MSFNTIRDDKIKADAVINATDQASSMIRGVSAAIYKAAGAEELEKAGFTLPHSKKSDVITECFIANRKYDIFEINTVLFNYDLMPPGSLS